jgi:Zn-dependent peptidase ImmA (M78 family)
MYKESSKRKINFEKIEYKQEADRLAAMLLMPYVFMRKYWHETDEQLAERFVVPIEAVKKRRKEVIIEREKICFVPELFTEGVEP